PLSINVEMAAAAASFARIFIPSLPIETQLLKITRAQRTPAALGQKSVPPMLTSQIANLYSDEHTRSSDQPSERPRAPQHRASAGERILPGHDVPICRGRPEGPGPQGVVHPA